MQIIIGNIQIIIRIEKYRRYRKQICGFSLQKRGLNFTTKEKACGKNFEDLIKRKNTHLSMVIKVSIR